MATKNTSLNNPIFQNADKAREFLESVRWPNGPFCPHCGVIDNWTKLEGKKHRPGLYQCNDCRQQFTVTVGTVFERSKVALNKWLLASYLITSSKKGISSHQIHRALGVTYKTAWFMTHRIRLAMEPTDTTLMGSGGGIVEADETYVGRRKGVKKARSGGSHKMKVFALIERGGKVRSARISGSIFDGIQEGLKNVSPDAHLMTDMYAAYANLGKQFASHETVNHGIKEWKRGNVHTNTIEGFFSVFKRGMRGVYQHCSEDHLDRYLTEFDFRYNHRSKLGYNDMDRAIEALKGIEGKRLTYLPTNGTH